MAKSNLFHASIFLAALALLFFLDQSIRVFISSIRTDPVVNIMGLISDFGSWGYLSVVTLALWGFGSTRKNKKLKIAGAYGLSSILTSRLMVEILKRLIGRPRPAVFDSEGLHVGPTISWGYDSFPSGHAASSFAFAYMLSRVYPGRGYLFFSGAAIISFSRIYLDVHYSSDIFAGGLLGLFSGMLLYKYLEPKMENRNPCL